FFIRSGRKHTNGYARPPVGILVAMGLTGITVFYILFNTSFYYTTAAVGALIQGFIPAGIIIMAVIFLKEKLRLLQVAGIILSVLGVLLLGFSGDIPAARNALLGNSLMLLSVVCWGAYTILSKSMAAYDPVYLTCMTVWIGTAGLLPAALFDLRHGQWPVISTGSWLAIIYLGFFSSAVCYILYNRALKVLPAVQVGNLMNFDPFFGALFAVWLLHDQLGWLQVTGALLVIGGVVLTSRR
ncbi:MAG: DMT family transporter, partial [Flavihumibacter sp.]